MQYDYKQALDAWAAQHKPDYSLHKVNPLKQLLACWESQDNFAGLAVAQTSVCVAKFTGPPGIGKTATAATVAQRLCDAISQGHIKRFDSPPGFFRGCPGQDMPEDWGGFPYATKVEGTDRMAMDKLRKLEHVLAEMSPHVVLIDEIEDVHESLQSAMLAYMDERHGQSVFIAASNPAETATNPTPLRPAFASRMWHGIWNQNPAEWSQRACVSRFENGRIAEYFPPMPVPIVSDDWMTTQHTWKAVLSNFVDAFPRERELDLESSKYCTEGEYSNNCPTDPEKQNKPFPCTRSRHWCSYGLAAATDIGATREVLRDVTTGFIGAEASEAFWSWYGRMDIQPGDEILDNPQLMHKPSNPMAAHLTMAGVLRHWNKDRAYRWLSMMQVFEVAYQWCPDLCQCFFPAVLAAQPDGEVVPKSKAVSEMAQVVYEMNKAIKGVK